MKKILLVLLVSLFSFGAFAIEGDIDAGVCWSNFKKDDFSAQGFGPYINGDLMFNKFFGLFLETSALIPYDSSAEDYYRDYNMFFISEIFGIQGAIPVNKKFNINIGTGFDSSYCNETIKTIYDEVSSNSLLMGVGAKIKAQLLFNDSFGLNFGCAGDWYLAGLVISGGNSDFNTFNAFCIRPEAGITIRFGSNWD